VSFDDPMSLTLWLAVVLMVVLAVSFLGGLGWAIRMERRMTSQERETEQCQRQARLVLEALDICQKLAEKQ